MPLLAADRSPPAGARRPVLDRAALVHVGPQGSGAGARAARRRGVLRPGVVNATFSARRAGWFVLAAVVLAASSAPSISRAGRCSSPAGSSGGCPGVRPARWPHGGRGGADRAVRARRRSRSSSRALRVRRRRDRHCRLPADRSAQARRFRDDAGGSDGGAAVDSGARSGWTSGRTRSPAAFGLASPCSWC